ncbi:MAG TPA: gamma-glutamylcyclotransferase family protein [bacterium]|nr:gamma-glutamylcyclotransferase family protein [bacterium]
MPTPRRGDRDAADGARLFVYGTLTDQFVYRVVTGENPGTTRAVLDGYRKVTSLKSFPYVVPQAGSKVEGVLVAGVSPKALAQLDQYESEGKLYVRRKATVKTAAGPQEGYVYVAGPELLAAKPAPDVEVADRVADFLKSRIERAIAADVPAQSGLRELEVRAREELLGEAVEELVREYFDHPGLPAFAVKHRLEESGLPSLQWLEKEKAAVKYAPHYLRLIAKTIIFNQLEEKVRRDFRGAVRVTDAYYERAVSALAALQYVGDNLGPIGEIMEALGVTDYSEQLEYTDYAVAAIFTADELYDRDRLEPYVERVKARRARGGAPLGYEAEFSPLGPDIIGAGPDEDPDFDGFFYFDDFDLGGRLWKLGGHVDNHRVVTPYRGRVRGFLEFAVGRYKILGDLSKPATADPFILSDSATAAVTFAEIKPHSLHLSIQLEEGRPPGKPPPPEHLICLLILGGDLNLDAEGILREKRLHGREIYNEFTGLDFSRYNEHRVRHDDANPAKVIEYEFPRLFYEHSYVDLVMALKGFQFATNPPPLELSPDSPHLSYNREVERELLAWAEAPHSLARRDIEYFLAVVEEGLAYETRNLGGHPAAFCREWVDKIERKLKSYNAFIWGEGKEWLIDV